MKTQNQKPIAELEAAEKPDEALAVADLALRPEVNAAAVISEYCGIFGDLNMRALSDSLSESIQQVENCDMKTCEAMLFAQAQALQSIFMNLARRSVNQEYMQNRESFLRMALKAQSQCRTTLETLAAIKNPPVIFAKQANIAQGHQQVNNNFDNLPPDIRARTHARGNKFDSNELLEQQNEQQLDTRTTSAPSRNDPDLETVAAVNRPNNKRR